MKLAATPIKTTDRIRPNTRIHGWSRAAPATASTLSRLMLTSAIATPQAALAKLFAGRSPECSSPTISAEPALSEACRSSRHIFQATHSKRKPPARMRPTTCRSWVTMSANAIRSTSAAATPSMITLRRCSAGNPAARAPTTIALSPARTMSMRRISTSAASEAASIRLEISMRAALAQAERTPQAMLSVKPPFIDHVPRDPQDDRQADVVDPMVTLDQAGDIIGRKSHEEDRKAEPNEEERRILARDRRDQQHIVEAHAEVRDRDLNRSLKKGLAPRRPLNGSRCRIVGDYGRGRVQLSPHVVGDPQEQQAAGEHEP